MSVATRVVRAYRFVSPALRWLIGSKGGEALDDPEHGDAADGVGRDEFGPARKWNADAAREDDQEHHHANEQEMAGLDAQAEEQQCRWNV
jgi:hypothetical protein